MIDILGTAAAILAIATCYLAIAGACVYAIVRYNLPCESLPKPDGWDCAILGFGWPITVPVMAACYVLNRARMDAERDREAAEKQNPTIVSSDGSCMIGKDDRAVIQTRGIPGRGLIVSEQEPNESIRNLLLRHWELIEEVSES